MTHSATTSSKTRAFTLIELLMVIAITALLAAILFPVLAQARKAARMSVCTSHLRQIGMAYALYDADYGSMPSPPRLVRSLPDRRILYCPEDPHPGATASSYTFRALLPPDFEPYWSRSDLNPNTVLAVCGHHLEQAHFQKGRVRALGPAHYPFKLVLRAGGSVQRVDVGRIHLRPVPGNEARFARIYPGEPGYDEVAKR